MRSSNDACSVIPVQLVESSTKPTSVILISSSVSGDSNKIPFACSSWLSNSMQEMKHQIIGELLDPCPVPCIGNLLQCL
jgi:hypothetical protein